MRLLWQQWVMVGFTLACMMVGIPIQAQISTDGTVGPAQNLQGPDYQIGDDLGAIHGNNLFHSFRDFNLNSEQTATFTASESLTINNVISRVTGGNPSNIDGLIRSTIPNADFYFLNPFGIVFGENARLDVQGSFHASTADYLRFGDGEKFHARNPNAPPLTIAPIEAFGFLDSPESISVEGSELAVGTGNTLSLIGGNLNLNSDSPPVYEYDESGNLILASIGSTLSAKLGKINLASIASSGEVEVTETGFNFSPETQAGPITARNIRITTTGEGGGAIYIRGGKIVVENSLVEANTEGATDGEEINVQGEQLTLNDGRLVAHTFGTGKGGNINIHVIDSIELFGKKPGELSEDEDISYELRELISARTYSEGEGGDVNLTTNWLAVTNRDIASFILGSGKGGDVHITINDQMMVSNDSVIGAMTMGSGGAGNITLEAKDAHVSLTKDAKINSATLGVGNAGDITLEARQLELTNGAQVQADTFGQGQGGKINVNVAESITVSGTGLASSGFFASTDPYSFENEPSIGGNAGNIEINTPELNLKDGIKMGASTFGRGRGGNVTINVDRLNLTNSSIFARSLLAYNGYNGPLGDAGNIVLNVTESLRMEGGSSIATTSDRDTKGGNISGTLGSYLYLKNSDISASVFSEGGDGGTITLQPSVLVLDNGKILAQADAGRGGSINIFSAAIIRSTHPGNAINADSRRNVNGEVLINAPDINLEELMGLQPPDWDRKHLLTDRCAGLTRDDLSSFTIVIRDVFPESPLNLKTHYLFDLD